MSIDITTDFTERFAPKTFSEFFPVLENMKGLEKAVATGTIHNKILISGPTGCGKTTLAMLIAAGVNCQEIHRPCGACEACKESRSPVSFDVHLIDCVSQGVKGIRELRDRLVQVPVNLEHKVVILDEAQRLTPDGQSQLLTILDASSCYFILCTTDPDKMNRALLNRCVRFTLSTLSDLEAKKAARGILERVGHTSNIEADSKVIARHSQGTPRRILIDAQSLCTGVMEKESTDETVTMRTLFSAKSHKEAWGILTRIKGNPDDVRRRILSYCISRLREGKNERASYLAKVFLPPLVFDAPKTDLMLRLYNAWESNPQR